MTDSSSAPRSSAEPRELRESDGAGEPGRVADATTGPSSQPPARPRNAAWTTVPSLGDGEAPKSARAPSPEGGVGVLEAGTLLAGRYRIERFVARGGMGEVYAAFDVYLRMRVALKTVRSDRRGRGNDLEKLRSEIALARRVTHPSVARTFDVGVHAPREGGASLAFLTMELLEGLSLDEHIADAGPLPLETAQRIATQLCEGLAAAHDAGIVHRDFKSSNVMLLPRTGGFPRAVVTDFGLAFAMDDGLAGPAPSSKASATAAAPALQGTPAYMAPEQVRGEPADARADVYALGVVLFEMCTGTLPFGGRTPLEVARARLEGPPPVPRVRGRRLPARWERVITRCLAIDPRARFASARDVAAALSPRGRARGRAAAAIVGAALVTTTAAFALFDAREQKAARARLSSLPSLTLAAWPFEAPAEDEPTAAAAASLLAVQLGATPDVRVLSPADVIATVEGATRRADEAKGALPDAVARELRRRTGADFVVRGRVRRAGALDGPGPLVLELDLQDLARTAHRDRVRVGFAREHLRDAIEAAAADVRERLGRPALSGEESTRARAALPSSSTAAQAYAQGQLALSVFDFAGAAQAFEDAVATEPSFALGYRGLSEALSAIDGARSLAAAERAFALAVGLSREQRLEIEGELRRRQHAWPEAVEVFRTLSGFFPENVNYKLAYASALVMAGRGRESYPLFDQLRAQPLSERDAFFVATTEIRVRLRTSDARGARALADEFAPRAHAAGARLMEAHFVQSQAEASWYLGDLDASLRFGEGAVALADESRNPIGAAIALSTLARSRAAQGRLDDARALYERSAALTDRAGQRYESAIRLTDLGILEARGGHLRAARARFEAALAAFRAVGDQEGIAHQLSNLAEIRTTLGEAEGVDPDLDEAEAIQRRIGMRHGELEAVATRATLLRLRGDLPRTDRDLTRAEALAEEVGDRYFRCFLYTDRGELARIGGATAAAAAALGHASDLAEALGDPQVRATVLLARARLAWQNDAPLAAKLAREAESVAAAAGLEDERTLALTVEAESLLRAGDMTAARAALDKALATGRGREPLEVRVSLALAEGRVAAAEHRKDDASRAFADADSMLAASGYVPRQLEVALERASLAGDRAAVRAHLDDAQRRGLRWLVARFTAPGAPAGPASSKR